MGIDKEVAFRRARLCATCVESDVAPKQCCIWVSCRGGAANGALEGSELTIDLKPGQYGITQEGDA